MNGVITVVAAFVAGVAGSLHCLAMCGGISSALGMRARLAGRSAPATLLHALFYQGGRLLSYALAGTLCGAFGGLLLRALNVVALGQWLRVMAGLMMILMGCQLLFGWRVLAPLEAFGGRAWRRIAPLSQQTRQAGPLLQALLLGALWGWLPCGLVYSLLLLGVLGGTPWQGATIMFAFGLGTLPMMLGSSLLAAQFARGVAQRWRALGGATLCLLGVWTNIAALSHTH